MRRGGKKEAMSEFHGTTILCVRKDGKNGPRGRRTGYPRGDGRKAQRQEGEKDVPGKGLRRVRGLDGRRHDPFRQVRGKARGVQGKPPEGGGGACEGVAHRQDTAEARSPAHRRQQGNHAHHLGKRRHNRAGRGHNSHRLGGSPTPRRPPSRFFATRSFLPGR